MHARALARVPLQACIEVRCLVALPHVSIGRVGHAHPSAHWGVGDGEIRVRMGCRVRRASCAVMHAPVQRNYCVQSALVRCALLQTVYNDEHAENSSATATAWLHSTRTCDVAARPTSQRTHSTHKSDKSTKLD